MLGGWSLAVAAFEFGAFNVRWSPPADPGLMLAAACSYGMTVIALALVYAVS